jgi:hypothetical protein
MTFLPFPRQMKENNPQLNAARLRGLLGGA